MTASALLARIRVFSRTEWALLGIDILSALSCLAPSSGDLTTLTHWWMLGQTSTIITLGILVASEYGSLSGAQSLRSALERATSPEEWRVAAYHAFAESRRLARNVAVLVLIDSVLQFVKYELTFAHRPGPVNPLEIAVVPIILCIDLVLIDQWRSRRQRRLWRAVIRASFAEAAPFSTDAENREHLATLLHDTIGRELSIMSIYANAIGTAGSLEPQEMHRALERVQSTAQSVRSGLALLVGDLLDSRPLSGSPARADGPVSPTAARDLDALVSRFDATLATGGSGIAVDAEPDVWAAAAEIPLSHVALGELLTNAVKYSARGTVRLAARRRDGAIELSVRNPLRTGSRPPSSSRRGLAILDRRLHGAGAGLRYGIEGEEFVAVVSLPEPVTAPGALPQG